MTGRFFLQQLDPRFSIVATGFWTVLAAIAWQWQLLGIGKWELMSYNARFHWRGELPPDPRVALVGIDEGSILRDTLDEATLKANPEYQLLREYPYPRKTYALALERLVQAGARVVVFDVLLVKDSPLGTGKEGQADNAVLRQALEKHRDKVVLGANFTLTEIGGGLKTWQLMMPRAELLPNSVSSDEDLVGFVNFEPDGDGFIRRMNPVGWPHMPESDAPYSLDALAVRKAFPKVQLPVPFESRMIQFAGYRGVYDPVPFHLLFRADAWKSDRPPLCGGKRFKDKIVLIGPRANSFHDEELAPFDNGNPFKMFGVDIHANAIATLLSRRVLRELDRDAGIIIILAMGAALALVLRLPQSPLMKLAPGLGMGAAYWGAAQIAFSHFDLFIPLVPVLSLFAASTASVVTLQALVERIEKQRARGFLRRYVSRNVAEELLSSGKDVSRFLQPKRKFVTVLMSDVRDFTSMTVDNDPEPFVKQLNEYLSAMVECVFRNHGTLDKFVGDAVMAVFGSPASQGRERDALNAVRTALEMRRCLAELNAKWNLEGRPSFRFGIGINAGEVMAGDIGSSQKAEFGVIGDAVNVSARVEGLTKQQKTDILITDSVRDLVKEHIEAELRGETLVKGRAQPVRIYALLREVSLLASRHPLA